MRWFVLCKGSAEGQEFKWYAVNSVGILNPEVPQVCNTVNGLIDLNSSKSSIALVRSESNRLNLFITKLVSTNQRDFASRATYAHLVAESENADDDDKLQLLIAEILDSKKINIDEFIHASGETKESGAVVDRHKLNKELCDCWARLLKEEIKSRKEEFNSQLKNEINKIVFETAKLSEPLRDRALFDNQLNQRIDFFYELLNPGSKYGDNRREQFISVVDDLVNFLEIGFIVDALKLYALTTSSKTLNVDIELSDRIVAKYSDDIKIELANQLRQLSLPKSPGILVVVTHNISIEKFEKIPVRACRVLCSGAEEGWHNLNFEKEYTTSQTVYEKKNLENYIPENSPVNIGMQSVSISQQSSLSSHVQYFRENHYDNLPKPFKSVVKLTVGSGLVATEVIGGIGSFGSSSIATGGTVGLTGLALLASATNDFKKFLSVEESTEENPPKS
jgi:hypothetical protein